MTFGSSAEAAPPGSAESCGPGWHWFEPPTAIGYSSGEDWVEVVALPARSAMSVDEIAECLVESGVELSRARRQALELTESHQRLTRTLQRLTSLSAFRNAFMRSAKGGYAEPIATVRDVELVRPLKQWYEDDSLADAELVDVGTVVVTIHGATFDGKAGARTIECGRVEDIEFSLESGSMHVDGWADEWYLRNINANGVAAIYAIQHINTDHALKGSVRYVGGWLDDPSPDPDDVRVLLRLVKDIRNLSPQTAAYESSRRVPVTPAPQGTPSVGPRRSGPTRPVVDFFLDEEAMPMPLCVVHDVDGSDELEVWLGTFVDKPEAMSAVDTVRKFLQEDAMRWSSVPEALNAAQFIALRCRGNLGLPVDDGSGPTSNGSRDDLASRVLASSVFTAQRERAQRVTLTDKQIGSLLRRLIASPGNRVGASTAAAGLGIPEVQLSGAVPMVQRLLNVEQFRVLDRDPDGGAVTLDIDLLKEQFEVGE